MQEFCKLDRIEGRHNRRIAIGSEGEENATIISPRSIGNYMGDRMRD